MTARQLAHAIADMALRALTAAQDRVRRRLPRPWTVYRPGYYHPTYGRPVEEPTKERR